jgi:hypothetical protein
MKKENESMKTIGGVMAYCESGSWRRSSGVKAKWRLWR